MKRAEQLEALRPAATASESRARPKEAPAQSYRPPSRMNAPMKECYDEDPAQRLTRWRERWRVHEKRLYDRSGPDGFTKWWNAMGYR